MPKLAAIVCWGILAPQIMNAEVYVRGVHHIPGSYRYAREVRTLDIVNEWWFGKDKVAFSTRGWAYDYSGNTDWRLVLDREKQRIVILNLTKKTYWEFPLSATLGTFVKDDALRWLAQFKVYGTLVPTGSMADVLGRPCQEFEIKEWIIRNDEDRFYDGQSKARVSEDVPFDWKLSRDLLLWVRTLSNPQNDYLRDLDGIHGFVLASEEMTSEGGNLVTWAFRVDEIIVRDPPAGTFDPPADFKRQDSLDIETLWSLRGIIYICPIY